MRYSSCRLNYIFVQADKLIMTKFTYTELAMRRILSPGLEYAAGKSQAVDDMRLSTTLHQDRWPEVSMTSFLFNQAELHRKAMSRSCPEAGADPSGVQSTGGSLDLNLGDLEDFFNNPKQASAQHTSNHEPDNEGELRSDGDE